MKIWNSRLPRLKALSSLLILSLVFGSSGAFAQDGKALFDGNCASCHKPHEDFTGPALQGAQSRWEKAGAGEYFYDWVRNSQSVIAQGVPYAKDLFNEWNGSVMTANAVTDEEIDAIFAYVEAYQPPVVGGGDTAAEAGGEQEGDSLLWWIIVGAVLLVVALGASGIRRQLLVAVARENNEEEPADESMGQGINRWVTKYWRYVAVVGLVMFIFGAVDSMYMLREIGIYGGEGVENYRPEQPIAFPHDLHAGEDNLAINCEYCHHSARKGKHAGIPSANVCMNCHKAINTGPTTGETEIQKIYMATGWDGAQYSGPEQPIVWNKVHNLPDHVFFSHAQHVAVGKLECQECHGPVEEMKVAEQFSPLTMKWCIDCHNEKEINLMGDDAGGYYMEMHQRILDNNPDLLKEYREDGAITVRELGGWECAKCHY